LDDLQRILIEVARGVLEKAMMKLEGAAENPKTTPGEATVDVAIPVDIDRAVREILIRQ
jgi:hypothetical protein